MNKLSTGVEPLDKVLRGGLLSGQVYLVRGQPGSGKTTLAMQFLLAGLARGESVLYITLAETEAQLRMAATSHGWDLGAMQILDIRPGHRGLTPENQYTIFHPADVELAPVTRTITEAVERVRPTRIVFDSLTELRLLSRDVPHYRIQVLALIDYLTARDSTTLFLGESGHPELDVEVTPIVQGVLMLSLEIGRDGLERRAIRVEKYRASDYQAGEHALRIIRGGLRVFPRVVATETDHPFEPHAIESGIPEFDRMLGGGLDAGNCTLLAGNSGGGKTTLGVALLLSVTRRNERAVLFTFDEVPRMIATRCEALRIPIREPMGRDLLHIRKVNPVGLHPDEFASWIQEEVERKGARMVMIDTLNGLALSTGRPEFHIGYLQQLVNWLRSRGVSVLLVQELTSITGDLGIGPEAMSYNTDAIVLLRCYEEAGLVRRALGVLKKRLTRHETRFHEFELSSEGLRVGEPVASASGILRGQASMTEGAGGPRSPSAGEAPDG